MISYTTSNTEIGMMSDRLLNGIHLQIKLKSETLELSLNLYEEALSDNKAFL